MKAVATKIVKPENLRNLKFLRYFIYETGTVPNEYKPHLLIGNYKGFMECHIENDFLIIWFDEDADIIKLVRLGLHTVYSLIK